MAESGPPPDGPGATAVDYRSWFTRLVQDHPGTWLTFLYLALTAIGLTYSYAYHGPFRISFLDYAETSDFLLAALREPRAIILSLLPALAIWLVIRVHRLGERRFPAYQAYSARRELRNERRYYRHVGGRARYFDISNTAVVVTYALLFTLLYGRYQGERVRRGIGNRVRVEFVSDGATAPPRSATPMLVGTTTRYVFLYYPERDSTYVVPADNVALIAFAPRPRRNAGRQLFGISWRTDDAAPSPPGAH